MSPTVAVTRVTCVVALIINGSVSSIDQMIKRVCALTGICHSYYNLQQALQPQPCLFVSIQCVVWFFVCGGSRCWHVCELESKGERERETETMCVCVWEWDCACMCAPVRGVVREMSLLLRVTDINLWESCTLQHTHAEGKRESGGANAIYRDDIHPTSQADPSIHRWQQAYK